MDINECMKEMTIEEKISLLEGSDKGFTNPIKRLNIPRILLADGPHGLRIVKGTDSDSDQPYTMAGDMEQTTAFPCEAAMAATWNEELLELIGKYMGEECQALGAGVILGPGLNGKRSPLGGRNFEYFSEDPYLSGKMSAAVVNGIQKEGIGACLKHYVLNDQETRRMSVDVHIDERTMWEIYLKPFEIAIKEANPWSIMAAYNKVDGSSMTENEELLLRILRKELGYEGVVLSDWGAVQDKVLSIKSGLDLQTPGPSGKVQEVLAAVEKGELTEEEIDERVRNVLGLVKKVAEGRKSMVPDWEAHHATAVQVAEESIVLLKNEGNILPLKRKGTVAVIGELAEKPYFAGGGSSSLTPRQVDIPLECISQEMNVIYTEGYMGSKTNEDLLNESRKAALVADVVLVFVGMNTTEGLDRENILLPEAHIKLIHEVAAVNENVIVITQCGSAIAYYDMEAHVKAILHAWIPGEGFGTAIKNILFGYSSPSGKLAETFPICLENTPAYQDFPGIKDDVYYREGILTGYRYYDTKRIVPHYPFGFGLSYTTFSYNNLKLSTHKLVNGEKLKITVDVKNTGNYEGKEVVQVYVRDEESYLLRPQKELKAFAKVALKPGEMKSVTIELTEDAFSYYLPNLKRFAVESGRFEILIGASSRDIRLQETVEFVSVDDVRLPLGMNDSFKDFLKDDRYEIYAKQLLKVLQVDETHMFYEMLHGVNLVQMLDLMNFMGIDENAGRKVLESLVERREISL